MLSNQYQQEVRERTRATRLASKKHDRAVLRQEAEFADQRLAEERERWELEKKEREIRLVNSSLRERIEMGMSLAFFLCAVYLLIAGSRSGQLVLLGGSGATGLISVVWVLQVRRESTARPQATSEG